MIIPFRDSATKDTIVALLMQGGVAVLPCDTMYGLCGRSPGTAERLRGIKQSSSSKQFVLLIPEIAAAAVLLAGEIDSRLTRHWPGPLTIVARGVDGGTLALRLPDDPFLRSVMAKTGPLYSTSVNRSGKPPLSKIDEIAGEFELLVDLVVDAGDYVESTPSTIVDATEYPWKVVRQGSLVL